MSDANAIHSNRVQEIQAIAEKAVPVGADRLIIEDSAAAWAKKSVQVGNLPAGGGGGLGYALTVLCPSSNPVDAETVYIANIPHILETNIDKRRLYIPKAGTIKVVDLFSYSTGGTNEDWSAYLRLNNVSQTLIATVGLAAFMRRWTNVGLNIPVVAGDWVTIKLVNPTWATNPTNVMFGGTIYIE